ncbi:MAG: lactate utilization protein [Gammaproteobacteria bacterium]
MSTRHNIFTKIRRSLSISDADSARQTAMSTHLTKSNRAPATSDDVDIIQRFTTCATQSHASVTQIHDLCNLPDEVTRYLNSKGLPLSIRMGSDPLLQIAFRNHDTTSALKLLFGASDGSDRAALSHARFGIAESGALVLSSGPHNPTTLNFLPEYHLVAVCAEQLCDSLEDALEQIGRTDGNCKLPRAVHLITGPSRSGDIEQKIIMGAHGPRALHIIIVHASLPPYY